MTPGRFFIYYTTRGGFDLARVWIFQDQDIALVETATGLSRMGTPRRADLQQHIRDMTGFDHPMACKEGIY